MSPTEAIAISLADKYLDSILPKFSKNMSPYIAEAEEVLNEKNKEFNGKIQTNISKVKNYCKAEEYHQRYIEKNRR